MPFGDPSKSPMNRLVAVHLCLCLPLSPPQPPPPLGLKPKHNLKTPSRLIYNGTRTTNIYAIIIFNQKN